ncbi:unnamed protein product [Ostreobium quekettii]|uniref:Uncharacterized protein n=1 Tax=Ostreobium quekettii TaxID=121088 RepID=A0A8S1IJS7_9CHLO|nr:unnamed protein product [Ostreobium quekettii]
MKLLAGLLLATCALALASMAEASTGPDYFKCYQLPHCHAQNGLKDCGWCYNHNHPNKGYGIPCERVSDGECRPVMSCDGEYLWQDSKMDTYGDKCNRRAVINNDRCRNLRYCWDQVGIDECGWCHVRDHPDGGWGIPCERRGFTGRCEPVAHCPGEYLWRDSDLGMYGDKCSHKCWNIRSCRAQRGIDGCGWCHSGGRGEGIPCSMSGGDCRPVKECRGDYAWRDSELDKYPWCT